jgi:protein-disulfide isomerase
MTLNAPSRRAVLRTAAGTTVLAAVGPAWAQKKSDAPISVEELMKPDALGDLVLGKADAPCTIVEYASMTCGHCGAFHNKVFPAIKEKYIATGKVRFIMREFPLDTLAAAASMLARCAGGEKTVPMIEVLFSKQEDWAFVRSNAVPELFKIAKQAGFTQESFDKCLTDQALLDKISQGRERASKQFGVDSTPTFFVNGKKLADGPSLEAFEKAIAEATKS